MKYKNIFYAAIICLIAISCNKGIDPISPVEPGTDSSAPVIKVITPTQGYQIKVPDFTTSLSIQIEVTDDIELKSVTLALDGKDIKTFTEFKDYRRLLGEYTQAGIANGEHLLTVKATDINSKTSTVSVPFAKVSPYVPKFAGEIFYMPFEGDYMELISFKYATKVGNPGFASSGIQDSKAYAGATDSYLTFPTTGLQGNEFSAAFWLKINGSPDRAGILVMGPPDAAAPSAPNNRNSGFRFFRESANGKQRFKLNVGSGSTDSWFDGGANADVTPGTNKWVHFAFTISKTSCAVYIDGKVVSQGAFTGVNWSGCDILSIMSGAPRFTGWSHFSDLSQMDELRLFNKALTASEIQNIILNDSPYVPKYSGEIFYMPFEDNFKELISKNEATKVGSPDFATGKVGKAYSGKTASYITFPTTELVKSKQMSAVFWMKVNATPDRAGILTVGPEDKTNAGYPATQNKRTNGFRFFREGSATSQQFKVNVGTGAGESWNDGGKIDPSAGNWVHVAFTVSDTKSSIYIDGILARESALTAMDWTGCDLLSIMSGAPRFTEWNHLSDLSLMDELRIFNKALSQSEIQNIMNAEK